MTKTNPPATIRIAATTYTVELVEDLHDVDTGTGARQGLNGNILYDSARMKIESKLAPSRRRVTLMHEALHGMFEGVGLEDHSEQTVMSLSHILTDTLRRNPAFVAWLMAEDETDATDASTE